MAAILEHHEIEIELADDGERAKFTAEYFFYPETPATDIDPADPAHVDVQGLLVQGEDETFRTDLLKFLPANFVEAIEQQILENR